MKIVHVIETLSPKFGGPVTVLRALAREQTRAGHKVTILTTNLDYPNGSVSQPEVGFLENSLVKVKYFHAEIALFGLSLAFARKIPAILAQSDILHVWSLYRFPQAYACYVARQLRLPYIVRPCGSLEPFLRKQSKISLPLKRLYEHFYGWPNLRQASAINCVTEREAENLPSFIPREKVFVLGNGLDQDQYKVLPPKGIFRLEHNLEGKKIILFLGRINFKKGLDLLVRALPTVARKHPNIRLVIAGPDNEGYGRKVKHWCRQLGIEEKVVFVGHLDREEVKRAYVDADVFVLPSYTENFGMTVVEAMACGCPVVISDQVNIWREVHEAGAGLVVSLDPGEIADGICRVLDDKRLAAEMGEKGRFAAQTRYAWPHIVDQLTQVYRKIIAQNRGKRRI